MNVTETSLGKRGDLSLENAETSNLTYMAEAWNFLVITLIVTLAVSTGINDLSNISLLTHSSIVNEGIKGNFRLLHFFFTKQLYTHKKHKDHKTLNKRLSSS